MADAHQYGGMTLNERLVVAGLLSSFDVAVEARDRAAMIAIMEKVEVQDAAASADTILQNLTCYGY